MTRNALPERLRVLLVEDDEDDALLARDLLDRAGEGRAEVEWAPSFDAGLAAVARGGHDVVLLDHHLGARTGLDFLARLDAAAGAADYLVKGEITPRALERAVRYAVARARDHERLRETGEALDALVRSSPLAIVSLDPAGRVTHWNPAAEGIFGWTAAEVAGGPLPTVPEEDRAGHLALLERVSRGQAVRNVEVRRLRRDGAVLEVSLSAAPLLGAGGSVRGIIGVMENLTAERARERELRQSHALLSTVVEGIGDPIYLKDPAGRYRMINGAGARALGRTPPQVVGKTDAELFPAPDAARIAAADERVRVRGEALTYESVLEGPGGPRDYLSTKYPYRGGDDGGDAWIIGISRDLTERRRAEREREAAVAQLEVERARLDTLFRQAPAFIAVLRGAGHVVEMANPACRRAAGGRELIGRRVGEALPEAGAQGFLPMLDEVYRTAKAVVGREVPVRLEASGAEARERFLNFVFQPLSEADGTVSGIFVHGTDVTDLVRARHDVERVAAERDAILRQIADGVVVTDGEGRVTFMNESARRWHARFHPGATLPEYAALDHLYTDEGRPFPADELPLARAVLRGETVTGATLRVRHPAGGEAVAEVSASPVVAEDGRRLGAVAAIRDVTERRRMEAELAHREAHYRRMMSLAPYTIYALDAEGRITELNPAGEQVLDRPKDEVLGMHFAAVVHPDDLPATAAAFRAVISGEAASLEMELRVVRPSGEARQLCITVTGIPGRRAVEGVYGIARDVTEERERDRQIRLLAAALESLPEGVSISDTENRIVYANTAHGRLLGYDPGAGERRTTDFVDEAVVDAEFPRVRAALEERGTWRGRIPCRRLADGRAVPVEMLVSRVESDGEPPLLFAVLHDATEELTREQQLRRAERLASLGTLIAGVAHELNNPLSAIKGFAQLMLMDDRPEEDREALEIMRREAERAAKIVADLRLVARQTQESGADRAPVDLNEVVRHVVKLRRYALTTRNVELREDLSERLPAVLGDRSQLEQVLLNLVVNAEQALSGVEGERRLILRTRPSGGGVAVHVVDNGPGIRPDHLDRVFDPFWTTKAPGEGTGLGLSLVHSLVAEHGGEVRVDSEPGKGAAFTVTLPRAPRRGPREGAGAEAETRAAPLRVLVVDDEKTVRRTVVRCLERRGHRVDEAAEGGEALRMLEEDDGYDVILSDLRMPGVSGEGFLEALRALGTGLEQRLVFVTGDAASADAARLLATARVPVLLKPFDLGELSRVVEEHASEVRTAVPVG
jgi:PAS domain S-box-containing protein